MNRSHPAILLLQTGKVFEGFSCGAAGETIGEVVFNTSMTGYQEILSDPSYKGQIIVMTEPHIGNVGANSADDESRQVYASGFAVREMSRIASNWRSQFGLDDYLIDHKIPAITGIDTRALTKYIRSSGAMLGLISTNDFDIQRLLKRLKSAPSMEGMDLVREVTCKKSYVWNEGEYYFRTQRPPKKFDPERRAILNVVVVDFGVKRNILRCLKDRGCQVNVVPAGTSATTILGLKPDGIMLSNGPGDPAAVTYAIQTVRELIRYVADQRKRKIPIFGICLGHQLLGLALGGKTFKLKFGHRGSNHPVKHLASGKIEITCQNHGFCVDLESIPSNDVEITHLNLNDHTLEGMRHKSLPIFSVQYHPEASAGPLDSRYLFDHFVHLMRLRRK